MKSPRRRRFFTTGLPWIGVLFAVSLTNITTCSAQTPLYSKLCDFPTNNRSYPGDYCTAGLTESPARPGTFFGQLALDENNSVVYWVNTKGAFSTGPGIDGNCPQGTLISAGDGTFWGTSGGMGGAGVIWYGAPTVPLYKVDANGAYALIYNFTFDQGESFNQLTLARGCIYGSATLGGIATNANTGGDGTLFKVTPDKKVIVLRQMDRTSTPGDAALPTGPLLLASDGNLYGTSIQGGTKGGGTVFKLDGKDKFSIVHSFVGTDGQAPFGCLVQGHNGQLYGTTYSGGKNGKGTLFSLSTSGKLTVVYSFGGTAVDGANPVAGLVMGLDGNLYGTTAVGGASGSGTAFRITPEGKESILHSFGASTTDGTSPCGVLTLGLDGNLYGTTSWGGVDNAGTAFKIVIETPPTLKIELSPWVSSIAAGNNIVYTISCTNRGSVTAYDVQLAGNSPSNTTLVSQGAGGNTWTHSGTQLSCDIGSIGPGKNQTTTLILEVSPTTSAATKIVTSLNGAFSDGTIAYSPSSSVTVVGHNSKTVAYKVSNSDSSILFGAGQGSSPTGTVSGRLQLSNKFGSLWMNFDVTSSGSRATWKPDAGSTEGAAQLQLIPPSNPQVDLLGSFNGADESLTVTVSPFSGGLGYAKILNELQLMGLLPGQNSGSIMPAISQAVPLFTSLSDFANAAGSFNQALADYSNSNWFGVNADLQNMANSLTALTNNSLELEAFEEDVINLNPAVLKATIKAKILNAVGLSGLANMLIDAPDVMSDILLFNLSAARHSGAVTSTFYTTP